MKSYKYFIKNLDCANCAKKIEKEIGKDSRFAQVVVNFNLLTLTFKTDILNPFLEVVNIVKRVEPSVVIYQEESEEQKRDYEFVRLLLALIFVGLSFFIKHDLVREGVLILAYLLLLYKTIVKAIMKMIKSHRIDENFLISISAIGAYILGEKMEGIMVVSLYVVGKILEEKAVNKSRNEIKDLLDLKIDKAYLKIGKEIKEIDAKELKEGDIVVVKKGDRVPADGYICDGETMLDTSYLTGESVLSRVKEKDKVLSGSINKGEVVEVQITHPYYESTAYKIFELTLNATNHKSQVETRVSKIASFYTPFVFIIAILIGAFLPFIWDISYQDSIYRALTFLVISCPCAIAISVPLSYFAGIGASSRAKVLVKGSNFLDALNQCDTIVFDKTGTITKGSLQLEKIQVYHKQYKKEDILNLIAMGEVLSTHPFAKVILNEVNKKPDSQKIKNFKEIDGKGLSYEVEGKKIKVGSASFVGTNKIANIFLSVNDCVVGSITFQDNIKENARSIIDELKKQNMKTIMLTGDNKSFASIIANKINIDQYACELLPEEKYKKMEELKKEHKVIFVGDGINDTPSLALADVGISMGEIGSNSAISASDIVIMNDNLAGIRDVLKIAKKTNRIIILNLIFALATKLIILGFATFGLANMWAAVFADTGVTLITILNSLRILKK